MLQKAYEQAKVTLVEELQSVAPTDRWRYLVNKPIEVQQAVNTMIHSLTHEEMVKVLDGTLTVADLERFKAPDCSLK